jgi:hypothetical protein
MWSGAAKPRRRPAKTLRRARPHLEVLEERALLNNRFVVPLGAAIDNATTFANLQAALTTGGLATGNTIEIEPGSVPGTVVNANLTAAFNTSTTLTIQGNPALGLAGTPQFTISDASIIAAGDTLNLNAASVGLIATGALTFSGNTNITGSILADINSTAPIPFTLAGGNDNLVNSTVVNDIPVSNVVLEVQTPATGSNNRISGNTFVNNCDSTTNTNAQVAYFGGSGASVTDKVSGNSFVDIAAHENNGFVVEESVTGLVIQNNSFAGDMGGAIVQFSSNPQHLQILGNTVNITGAGPVGIALNGGATSTTTSVTVSNNVLNTAASGTGVNIGVNPGTLNVSVQGNDFHNCKIGVNVFAGGSSIAGIDLGGGSQGSVGGNNFRAFTAAATPSAGAIIISALGGTIQAQRNLFAVANPQTVISATGGVTVNATALSANAAFVDVLYEDFLKRPGDTTSANDAGGWVALLNGATPPATVAGAIIRSAEALGLVVDGLYLKVLGRVSDPAGRAAFVSFLQNGGTLEQAVTGMMSSPEFNGLTGSDGGFVEALYLRVLGRNGSGSEVSGWLGMLPNLGRAGVANAFVKSSEFRTDVVQALYGTAMAATVSVASLVPNMLHRNASPMEVNGWVNSAFDIDTIVLSFAVTGEFFNNG